MFQATRRRLALWYATVTAVLMLFFATGVYLYVRNTLVERIDDTLHHVVEIVERSLIFEAVQSSPDNLEYRINLEASFRDNAEAAEDDHIDLEWFSPTGELVWSTFSEPLEIPIHYNRAGETVRAIHRDWSSDNPNAHSEILLRQITERVQKGRQVLGYLRVSHPWFEVTKPSRQLMVDLSAGIGLMAISVAAIGWLLSDIAMKPVRAAYISLRQFTSDASHELRNPIATIQANVQFALADPEIDSNQRSSLQVIERLTRRIGRLVDDLLFLARQDSGIVQPQWQSVPLDALLIEVLEEQQLTAKAKEIKLNLELVDRLAEFAVVEGASFPLEVEAFSLQADWDQLTRLFTNLVSNALQYTPAGGGVEVELEQFAAKTGGIVLQVKVKDTGIGISKEALPHLFDRFYRVDPARSHDSQREPSQATGSGLGLAIALAIVENHKGQIQIDSQLQQGTTVTVTLPGGNVE
ncbi:sensor histidine kinase [Desertifilum sp. FACHB-1129]|uniref:histidine kinase n=2 Tax=Desertifilum tharense IPPAS B-1220 TaxID=1781255 RepID=A0A1E5QEL8_9CYAN|nr:MULTISPECIES: ATP-binding protein [Desertifilum]MDA0213424.1 ATP-binding protein [Cyanobacteria bacterium FC1]MBD2314892.1 sensor histidine kinase [Desertifilum sp. FACHB-1129]MBD2322906.1 sensor histidine kinase [Desertifilum sp. FACHB-866]MBD2335281.1 sensor histidine kinase [Desertifilum sp. FACHB-868]OEJ73034.1 two-component sensor histidine kinase [Desertifilum tharense IPPAS B-1220]